MGFMWTTFFSAMTACSASHDSGLSTQAPGLATRVIVNQAVDNFENSKPTVAATFRVIILLAAVVSGSSFKSLFRMLNSGRLNLPRPSGLGPRPGWDSASASHRDGRASRARWRLPGCMHCGTQRPPTVTPRRLISDVLGVEPECRAQASRCFCGFASGRTRAGPCFAAAPLLKIERV